jgi:hypothetical protein
MQQCAAKSGGQEGEIFGVDEQVVMEIPLGVLMLPGVDATEGEVLK